MHSKTLLSALFLFVINTEVFSLDKWKLSLNAMSMKPNCSILLAIETGVYTPKNILPTRFQIHENNVFLAYPRFLPGVPITLAKTDLNTKECLSQLEPFPNLGMQTVGRCQAFQSVVDIFLDTQDILWVLDSGTIDVMEKPLKTCAPKIVALCAVTGSILRILDLSNIVLPNSELQYISAEIDSNGNHYLFISDAGTQTLIVLGPTGSVRRVPLPSCSRCIALQQARLHGTRPFMLLACTGDSRIFVADVTQLINPQTPCVISELGTIPYGRAIIFLGTDLNSILYLRYENDAEIFSWSVFDEFKMPKFKSIQRSDENGLLPVQVAAKTEKYSGLPEIWYLDVGLQYFVEDKSSCTGIEANIQRIGNSCV